MSEPTAYELIQKLIVEKCHKSTMLANYTPGNWWECDVFQLTQAGYWHEYEVKVSRSDFFADKKKSKWGPFVGLKDRREYVTKHEVLELGLTSGPSRFSFVTPKGLLGIHELPKWAGLIEGEKTEGNFILLRTVRSAPRIHNEKARDGMYRRAMNTGYHRYHWQMHGITRQQICFAEGEGI